MEKLKPILVEQVGNGWLVTNQSPTVAGALENREAFVGMGELVKFVADHFGKPLPDQKPVGSPPEK